MDERRKVARLAAKLFCGLWMACGLVTAAIAEVQPLQLQQFDHTAWSLRDGAPSQVYSLAQTSDGFLWLGTANGLWRFDGVRFELYQPPRGQRFPKASVQSLVATPDGGLWIGYTLGGTSFLKNGNLENHELLVNKRGGTVWYLAVDADGSIWAACANGISHFVLGHWQDIAPELGFVAPAAYRVFFDREFNLWVATDDVVYKRPQGSSQFLNTGVDAGSDAAFEQSTDGTIWISDARGVHAIRPPINGVEAARYALRAKDLVDLRFDASGGLWVLSTSNAVTRLTPPDLTAAPAKEDEAAGQHFTARDGMTSDRSNVSYRDREGSIWVGSTDGLDRFRTRVLKPAPLPRTFAFYALAIADDRSLLIGTEASGLQRLTGNAGNTGNTGNTPTRVDQVPLERIACVYRSPDGKLWLGAVGGVGYLLAGKYVPVPLPPQLMAPGGDAQAMTAASNGDLWFQAMNNNPILRLHDGLWSPVAGAPPGSGPAVVMMTDHSGRIWAGFLNGIVVVYDKNDVKVLRSADGISIGNVMALHESGAQTWIGGELGLEAMTGDKPVPIRFAGGDPIRGISGILRLEDGSLWLNALSGIVHIEPEEVNHVLRDPTYEAHYILYDVLDGLPGKAPQIRPLPSIVSAPDGTLWFSTTNGVVSLDPKRIPRNLVIPPVVITAVKADGKAQELGPRVQLLAGTQDVEFDYTALSLAITDRVHFRYRLQGFDKEWQNVGTRRQAFYPHLPPGRYVLQVIACNNDGLWNEVGATMAVELLPTFYQGATLKFLIAFLFVASVWTVYRYRLRLATDRIRIRLFERFAERERIARDLHDTFFQGIQSLLQSVHLASRRLPIGDESRAMLEQTLNRSDGVMLQGRQLVLDMRSQASGVNELATDLRSVCNDLGADGIIQFDVSTSGEAKALNSLVSEELYKIGREAINNAVRHADAKSIRVTIAYERRQLRLAITDDGRGIDSDILKNGFVQNHWGLPGMRERATKIGATLSIARRPEGGTTVQVSLPARLAHRQEPRRRSG